MLEDGELAEISAHGVRIMKFDGTPVTRTPRQIEWDAVAATKGGYQALSAQRDKRAAAGMDRYARRSRDCRISRSALRDRAVTARAAPETIGRIVMVCAGASWTPRISENI